MERPRSLVLVGKSRIGKTEWARSLGKAMYFCNLFSIDDWDDAAQYTILDDIDIKYFPHWKFFLGCQKEGVLTDKYRKKRRIRNGKPCIWLCNPDMDPRGALSRTECGWLDLNCDFVEVNENLFD